MQPTQNPQPNSSSIPQLIMEQPTPPGRRPPKKMLAGIGVALVIVAVGVWLILAHPWQLASTAPQPTNGPAMTFQPNTTTVKYGGTDVVQACNLIPQDELANAGYKIDSGNDTSIFSRTYFNGQGATNLKLGQLGFKVVGGSYFNTCSYLLAAGLSATAIVVQPSYVQNGSFSSYVSDQEPTTLPAIQGVTVSKFADPTQGNTEYALIAPNGQAAVQLAVESTVRGQDPSVEVNAERAILPIVAKNLASQSTKAAGPAELIYIHQAFPASYAKACQLTDNSDFKKIYGVDQAPLITENGGNPGTATVNGVNATFVDNQCLIESYVNIDDSILHPSADFSIPDTQYLTIRTESYLNDQAAQAGFSGAKQASKDVAAASGIGDEAFFASKGGGLNNPLILRKGRFIVELSPTQIGVSSTQSAQQITSELMPLGKKVAGEL